MLFELDNNKLKSMNRKSFKDLEIKEHQVEAWIEQSPNDFFEEEIIIITKQFSGFDKTNERLDLLGLDKKGKLVIIEVKRDGDCHRDKDVTIQSIKYAAYCSTLTISQISDIYAEYKNITPEEAKKEILQFIENQENDSEEKTEFEVDNKPRIIIIGKDFHQEVTASVLWLVEEYNLDIMCITVTPFVDSMKKVYLSTKIIIPLKEASSYRIHKIEKERKIEESNSILCKAYNNFFEELNDELFSKKPLLEKLMRHPSWQHLRQYGTAECHYEIIFAKGNSFEIRIDYESNKKDNNLANSSALYGTFDSDYEKMGYEFKELTKNCQISCSKKINARVDNLTVNELNDLKVWAVEQMIKLYDLTYEYMKKNHKF